MLNWVDGCVDLSRTENVVRNVARPHGGCQLSRGCVTARDVLERSESSTTAAYETSTTAPGRLNENSNWNYKYRIPMMVFRITTTVKKFSASLRYKKFVSSFCVDSAPLTQNIFIYFDFFAIGFVLYRPISIFYKPRNFSNTLSCNYV